MTERKDFLYIDEKGIIAKGYKGQDGFIVCEGSQAVVEETPSLQNRPEFQRTRSDRAFLIEQGILKLEGNVYVFARDYSLGSPSNAANVVLGVSGGLDRWKEKHDTPWRTTRLRKDAMCGESVGELEDKIHQDKAPPLNIQSLAMPQISDADLLEVFFGKRVENIRRGADGHIEFDDRDPIIDTNPQLTKKRYALKWKAFEKIRNAVVPRSPSIADYLLLMLWIHEFEFGMEPLRQDDVYKLVQRSLALSGTIIGIETMVRGFDTMLREEYLQETDERVPGGAFESGWVKVYSLTLDGERAGKKLFEESPPTTPTSKVSDVDISPVTIDESLSETIDVPPIFIAASGKSNKQLGQKMSAQEAYNASEPLEEPPDGMILEGHSKKALTEMENAIFQGTYRAMARFEEPIEEEELERIHRLKGEGWTWRDIVKKVDPGCPESEIERRIGSLKKQYRRAYGSSR